jgi:hypothetical protein
MALIKLQFRPGVNRDQTNYTGEGGWWETEKVRFFSGFPQKIGGWASYTSAQILGICRQMLGWITTFGDNFCALGTNKKVYIEAGGTLYDITPLRDTTAAGDVTFAASNGSSTLTVTDNAHGAVVGDYVTYSGAVTLGGNITADVLNQNYEIATVIDVNSYTIIAKDTSGVTVTANASDTGNGGAGGIDAVVGAYEISTGNAIGDFGYGWGTGGWGRNGWGQGSGGSDGVFLAQRDWWFSNFDNDLAMNIRNGAPYYWERGTTVDPSTALGTRAITLQAYATATGYEPDDVPAQVGQLLLSQNDKHLLAFGAVPYGSILTADFDPLLIRWADQDNPGQWEPLATNSAGFIRVSRGSRIIRAMATRQEILIWTDSNLYTLQFLGTTDVFALQEYADNISIASPRGVVTANNITYWMGADKFYVYTGRVNTLPCTVRKYVFNSFNAAQAEQVISGTNEAFNEVWWFYPSANSDVVDKYVVYNYGEDIWYFGSLSRTAWLDSPLRQYPQAIETDYDTQIGTMYDQEYGNDADGSAIESYIQSNDFDIADGEKFILTKRILTDVSFESSTVENPEVTLTMKTRNFPGSAFNSTTDDTANTIQTSIDSFTAQVFIRARARQMAFKVSSEDLGVAWALGTMRIDGREDGQR